MATYTKQRKMSKEERAILTKARFATVSKFVAEMAPLLSCNWQSTKNEAVIRKRITSNCNRLLRDELNTDYRYYKEDNECKARFVPYQGSNKVVPCELRVSDGKLQNFMQFSFFSYGYSWNLQRTGDMRVADVFRHFGLYRHVIMWYYYAILPGGFAKKGTIWLATNCNADSQTKWRNATWNDVAVECFVDGDYHFNMDWPISREITLADLVPECKRIDAPYGVGAFAATTGGHFVVTKVPRNYLNFVESLAKVGAYSFLVDPVVSGALLGLIPFYGGAATFAHIFRSDVEYEVAKSYFPRQFSRSNMHLVGHKYLGANIYDVLESW